MLSGERRIKYNTNYLQVSSQVITENFGRANEQLVKLGAALNLLEKHGAAPILPDGKVGGNAAFLSDENGILFVSQSGKYPGAEVKPENFCAVNNFDRINWEASYFTQSDNSIRPSSDTPLLWASIVESSEKYSWLKKPKVALHGHAISDEKSAEELNLPISPIETLFSTPEDLIELEKLFSVYPYPQHHIYIRKNHGFFLLADSVDEALDIFKDIILPHLQKNK